MLSAAFVGTILVVGGVSLVFLFLALVYSGWVHICSCLVLYSIGYSDSIPSLRLPLSISWFTVKLSLNTLPP